MTPSLLFRYATGRCTPQERALIEKWAGEGSARRALLDRIADPAYVSRQLARRQLVSIDRPMADMKRRIEASRRRVGVRILSIAAAVVVIIGVSFIFLNIFSPQLSSPAAITKSDPSYELTDTVSLHEIKHGSVRARLLTSNGTSIDLHASDTVMPANHCAAIASSDNSGKETTRSLCLDVPRGGEFKVMLEDSTEVWLNSESTLVYPEIFGSSERRVCLTGEAYFSVRKDASRPFCVVTDGQIVKVYGTMFNVRAYPGDSCVYTTLEQGSISISRTDISSGEVLISPGHQARLNLSDRKLNLREVDPKVITGWRHGRFVFEEQPLSVIMRDLSRWYDFKYEFTDPVLESIVFMGSIPRYTDFATAISIIEKSGNLRFTTDGHKVIVSPMENNGKGHNMS
ncbi:MAG: DUF4974 domain-containing protein [Bacteroides sp.]|nr:DUF4974 domain-containing protein [Bacteroides sp.]